MQAGQRARYAQRIERAIALLERKAAAGEVPALGELAAEAAMSDYHFHRVFRAMTGETVGAAVARVRLGGSLPALDESIMAATGQSGYATSQAYARALRELAGASPSELREDLAKREEVASALARPVGTANPPLTIAITSFAPLRLTALRNVGDYAELNSGYGALFELLMEHIAPESVTGLYGLPHDDPREVAASECRFDCAVTTSEAIAASGLASIELPGGLALRMDHAGDYDLIHPAIDALYAEAIAADLPIADRPLVIHYHHDPEEVPVEDLRAEVWLMLES